MFERLCEEEGEEFVVEVLKRIYQGLHSDIKKTLSVYVKGVIKNIKSENIAQASRETRIEERQMFKQDEYIEIIKEKDNEIDYNNESKNKNIEEKDENTIPEETLMNIYMNFSESKKNEIEEKAKEIFAEDSGVPLSPVNLKIFNNKNVKKLYIRRVLKEMFGL